MVEAVLPVRLHETFGLPAGEILVWQVEVPHDYTPDVDITLLDEVESKRAASFKTAALRAVFVAAHASLRRVLAARLGVNAKSLTFDVSEWGKPSLRHPRCDLEFNISHSANRILIAVSSAGPVGVDVEKILPEPPYEVASIAFSQNERAVLERVPAARRGNVFYDLWTRKEALVKAMGLGLDIELQDIDVSPDMQAGRSRAMLFATQAEAGDWSLLRLPSIAGFSTALSMRRHQPKEAVGEKTRLANFELSRHVFGYKKLDSNIQVQ